MSEVNQRKTATIVTTTGGGTFHSVDCPYCGKSMILGKELSVMMVYCRECCKTFDLRHARDDYHKRLCPKCSGGINTNGECMDHCDKANNKQVRHEDASDQHTVDDKSAETSDETSDDKPVVDDGSSGPFNPPPAKPFMPDYPIGDSRRGPLNWPVHYDGRHN